MHSVDLLEEALRVAMNSGFEVRQEWLHEKGGGACRIGKKQVLFVDLSLTAEEQLAQVVQALRSADHLHLDATNSADFKRLLPPASA